MMPTCHMNRTSVSASYRNDLHNNRDIRCHRSATSFSLCSYSKCCRCHSDNNRFVGDNTHPNGNYRVRDSVDLDPSLENVVAPKIPERPAFLADADGTCAIWSHDCGSHCICVDSLLSFVFRYANRQQQQKRNIGMVGA